MKYSIHLRNPDPDGDYYLPLFRGEVPAHINPVLLAHTKADFVHERLKGFSKDCPGDHCHVIDDATGEKYCPILFSDLVKPGWTAKDIG